MDIVNKLNSEFRAQDFSESFSIERYKRMAEDYALLENAIAVLSDMSGDKSYIYYGAFARSLGINENSGDIDSIWEDDILQKLHPDDLNSKHLQELRFFYFIKRQNSASSYCLAHKLRMRNASGEYISILHRQFYIYSPEDNTLRLALCLYNPLSVNLSSNCFVINTISGEMIPLEQCTDDKILSNREREVLQLIDKGLRSRDIADRLSISKNTVSRHRQEILAKLQVKNSIEACRVAKALGII